MPSTLFKRICLPIMILLMGLLALGPFLHAHYGSSRLLGFHLDGVVQTVGLHQHFEALSISEDTEEESAAVGIAASHTRQSLQDSDEDMQADFVAFLVLLFVALASAPRGQSQMRTWFLRSPHAYAPGFPPLAHAPPMSNM